MVKQMVYNCASCGKELTYYTGVKLSDADIYVCGKVEQNNEDSAAAQRNCLEKAVVQAVLKKGIRMSGTIEPIKELKDNSLNK